MAFQDYDPGAGSVEDLWEQATGTAPKKPKVKKPYRTVRKGEKIDKSDPDYRAAKYAAERGMPPFDEVSYIEAVMFDNGATGRKPGMPRYQIKLGWTCAAPHLIDRQDRSQHLMVRYIPLAVREQARDNWNRKRRKQGQFSFHADERKTLDTLMQVMQETDAARGEGEPPPLIGCVQHRFGGEGTIRHAMFGLVTWRLDDGNWLPNLMFVRSFTGEMLQARHRTGEHLSAIVMRPGKGEGVLAFGTHYSDEMLHHMRVPVMDDLLRDNLLRMKGEAA